MSKIRIFADFDGTITTTDLGAAIVDHCMTTRARKALDVKVLNGEETYRYF